MDEEKAPEDMTRKELIGKLKLHKEVSVIVCNPYMNPTLVHPDTPTLKKRVLANEVLRLYYRPDLYDRFGRRARPTEEERVTAFKECTEGLDQDVVWRTACTVGVNHRNNYQHDLLSDHLCVAVFCHLSKADVPYEYPELRPYPYEAQEDSRKSQMYSCVCGRSYRYQPGLSRHQNGSVKNGIAPCARHLKHLVTRVGDSEGGGGVDTIHHEEMVKKTDRILDRFEEIKARLIDPEDNHDGIKALDYDPRNMPSFVKDLHVLLLPDKDLPMRERIGALGRRVAAGRVMRRVLDTFKTIHLNKDHPEYWNVLLVNVKTMRLVVLKDGRWVQEDFKTWARSYGRACASHYCKNTESADALAYYVGLFVEESDNREFLKEYYQEMLNLLKGDEEIRNHMLGRYKRR